MKKTFDLAQGDYVRLVDFGQTLPLYKRKLLTLGITSGVEVRVIRVAPLGCPIQIEVRGSFLALRKDEACHLQWDYV